MDVVDDCVAVDVVSDAVDVVEDAVGVVSDVVDVVEDAVGVVSDVVDVVGSSLLYDTQSIIM